MRIYGPDGVKRMYLEGLAVSDHSELAGRSASDSHPIAAITDLQTELDDIDTRLDALEAEDVTLGAGVADNTRMLHSMAYFLGE